MTSTEQLDLFLSPSTPSVPGNHPFPNQSSFQNLGESSNLFSKHPDRTSSPRNGGFLVQSNLLSSQQLSPVGVDLLNDGSTLRQYYHVGDTGDISSRSLRDWTESVNTPMQRTDT
eukprot:scaffold85_cov145-Alexandrium_tamarense.AAC.45